MAAWSVNRMDFDIRKATPMLYEGGTQIAGRERRMHPDGQSATLATVARLQSREGGIHLVNDAPCSLQKFLTGGSRPGAAAGSFEQHRPKAMFQIAKPPAKRGLPDAQLLRCLPEAPMLGRNNRPSQILKLDSHLAAPHRATGAAQRG